MIDGRCGGDTESPGRPHRCGPEDCGEIISEGSCDPPRPPRGRRLPGSGCPGTMSAPGRSHDGGGVTMPNRREFLVGSANLVGAIALGDAVLADEPGGDVSARARQFVEDPRGDGSARWRRRRPWRGGTPTSPARTRTSPPRRRRRTGSTPPSPTASGSPNSRRSRAAGSTTRSSPARSRCSTSPTWRSRSTRRCSGRSPPRRTPSRRRSTSTAPGWTARRSPTARSARSSRTPTTRPRRKAVWEASKAVGPVVEADLKALVKLRNEAARVAGVRATSTPCSSPSTSRTRARSSSCSTNSTP